MRTSSIIIQSVQETVSCNGDITDVFSEQKAVGMAVSLRTQHHRGGFISHVNIREGRQIVLYMKARVQVTQDLELDRRQYVKNSHLSWEGSATKSDDFNSTTFRKGKT